MLEDLAVGHEAEGAEADHHWDRVPNVRDGHVDARARDALDLPDVEKPNVHRRCGARVVDARLDLGDVRVFGRLLLLEDVHRVVRHLLLSDEHLLRAVDHEVASLVVRALSKVGKLLVVRVGEDTIRRAQHDGHLPEEDLGQLLVLLILLAIRVNVHCRALHVHVERRGIRQIAQARLVGEHGGGALVGLAPLGLREVDLAKRDLVRARTARLVQRVVLLLRDEVQRRALVHDLLDRVHDERIKGVELLSHETLLLEVR